MEKKKSALIFSVFAALIVISTIAISMQTSGLTPTSKFMVYASGTPDAYDNQIHEVRILQNATGTWSILHFIDSLEYYSGISFEIPADVHTRIDVEAWISKDLATSEADAESKTRVNMTVAGMIDNEAMTVLQTFVPSEDTTKFAVVYKSSVWVPVAETTYLCTARYEAFY